MASVTKCSFCNRPRNEVKNLFGPQLSGDEEGQLLICNRCVETATEAMSAGAKKGTTTPDKPAKEEPLRKPKEIKAFLDTYVIAQERAKVDMAVAIYNHFKRRSAVVNKETDIEIDKANILMLGPSGTGKTHIARTIARFLNIPFFVGDATRLTQAGYVGDDVETLLQGLVQNADGDIDRAQWGIIFIDEIDKIARSSGRGRAGYRDVSGEGVQQALLKLLEGSRVNIPRQNGKNLGQMMVTDTIDTTNILFICSGSFSGIEESVFRRLNKGASLGFGAQSRTKVETTNAYPLVTEDDILDFGIIPELKGRLPVLTSTYPLTEDEMMVVLTEPKNSIIRQVQALFAMDNVDLVFEEGAIRAISKEALKRSTGARALRTIVEGCLAKLFYDVPSNSEIESVIITEATVGGGEPMLKYRQQTEEVATEKRA